MELIILVLEVILLIIKSKVSPEEATRTTASFYNISYSKLWEAVSKYLRK